MDPDLERILARLDAPAGARANANRVGRAQSALRGRFMPLALGLALVELVALLVWRPGTILAVTAALLLLGLAAMAWSRLRPGLARDIAALVAMAQAFIVAVPILVGISIGIGLLVAVALLVVLALVLFSRRRRR
ncbi:MAG: hypothetical protein HYX33_03265 [Actinobacteria bacterium]|nr:hypothetical protein [Actinomycetota bacterium]